MRFVKREPVAIIAGLVSAVLGLLVTLGADLPVGAEVAIIAGINAAAGVGAAAIGVVREDRVTAVTLAGALPALVQVAVAVGLELTPEVQQLLAALVPVVAAVLARSQVTAQEKGARPVR